MDSRPSAKHRFTGAVSCARHPVKHFSFPNPNHPPTALLAIVEPLPQNCCVSVCVGLVLAVQGDVQFSFVRCFISVLVSDRSSQNRARPQVADRGPHTSHREALPFSIECVGCGKYVEYPPRTAWILLASVLPRCCKGLLCVVFSGVRTSESSLRLRGFTVLCLQGAESAHAPSAGARHRYRASLPHRSLTTASSAALRMEPWQVVELTGNRSKNHPTHDGTGHPGVASGNVVSRASCVLLDLDPVDGAWRGVSSIGKEPWDIRLWADALMATACVLWRSRQWRDC